MSEEKIVLNLSETNDLIFKMKIKGSSRAPSIVRLVFEGRDYSYSVPGSEAADGNYKFVVPSMEDRGLDEGEYKASVEVVVDGRHFLPIQFDAEFVRPIEVQAEAVIVHKRQEAKPLVETTAKKKAPIAEKAPEPLKVEASFSNETSKKFKTLREDYEERRRAGTLTR